MKIDNIIITLGSPYGIGYEIFLRTFKETNLFKKRKPVCIGSSLILELYLKILNIDLNYSIIKKDDDIPKYLKNKKDSNNQFFIIDIDAINKKIERLEEISVYVDGLIAYNSINYAAKLVKEGTFDGIVTLPVNKKNINIIDNNFKGHTEFFRDYWNEKDVFMCFISKKINVLLITTHIPLSKVSESLNEQKIEKAIYSAIELKKNLNLQKKICFLGLNPHAGEQGLLGYEEIWIKKIIEKINKNFNNLEKIIVGPVPADTAFTERNINKYSIFIALYHDQGLIPFKILAFDEGVNLSFGMKHIRTSVDHGTGVDIIGKKIASLKSFINAYKLILTLLKSKKKLIFLNNL